MHLSHCLECEAPLNSAVNQGLCGRCMLRLGLASQFGENSVPRAGAHKLVPPPLFPFEFGHYEVVRLLGRGGMGAVYEANDRTTGRRVALKVLGHSLDSSETRTRFLREGLLAASVNHPHCVYVFGTEEIEGTPVISMELVGGGTLQERVAKEGPLPVGQAVDLILQVLSGLEAAHAVGILHRDVKPSNCFLEANGRVKVGDFGLSISTLVRAEAVVTTTGSVLGTPAFSAPEQLRGEVLDARSDLYAVGATLYFLLTGRAPFEGENLVGVLASVLDRPALSPQLLRADIPEALAQVVLRCLSKPADDRYSGYEELRRALLPFAPGTPVPASLVRRLVAGAVDGGIISMVAIGVQWLSQSSGSGLASSWWLKLGLCLAQISYYGIGEGRWGMTPGKCLVGLRVIRGENTRPGMGRAFGRATLFMLPALLMLPASLGWTAFLAWFAQIYPFLLSRTAKASNGFATLLDLITGTRVVLASEQELRVSSPRVAERVDVGDSGQQCGPFRLLELLSEDGETQLWQGFDSRLLRRVWVRKMALNTPELENSRKMAARPGRLRWLQGQRGEQAWDAFEADPGRPLLELLEKRNPWASVRYWLADLAEELAAIQAEGSEPERLSLDRVWITAAGRAKLLDFRAPGITQPTVGTAANAAQFLNQVAISALEGRVASVEEGHSDSPQVPLPLGSRGTLLCLRQSHDLGEVIRALKSALSSPAEVSVRHRVAMSWGTALPALFVLIFGLLFMPKFAEVRKGPSETMAFTNAIMSYVAVDAGMELIPDRPSQPRLDSLEVYIVSRFGKILREENMEAKVNMFALGPLGKRAKEFLSRHPNPTEQEVAEAKADLGAALDATGELVAPGAEHQKEAQEQESEELAQWDGWVKAASLTLSVSACLSVLVGLCFRGGLLMRGLGIAVVNQAGNQASRWRIAWRATLGWIWWVPAAWAFAQPTGLGIVVGVALLLGAGVLVLRFNGRNSRGISDRLAGTWLVPR
jgi:hypothetical protein